MNLLTKLSRYTLKLLFCLAGLSAWPCFPSWMGVLYRLVHIAWSQYRIISLIGYLRSGSINMALTIGSILFIVVSWCNIIGVCEAYYQQDKYEDLLQMHHHIDQMLQRLLSVDVVRQSEKSRVQWKGCLLLLSQVLSNLGKITLTRYNWVRPTFWLVLSVEIGVRIRYIQMIVAIMEVNWRVELLMGALHQLAAHNLPKSRYTIAIWRPYGQWEYDQLNAMRFIYGQLHMAYELINQSFGWSILTIFITSFFEFVCNAFWCFHAWINDDYLDRFLFNTFSTTSLGYLVWAMFWYTNVTQSYSQRMGCVIYKIVKPVANKRYNDLVTEFSLQILHQQFTVTAKQFFDFNLQLMGTMVAAIVTYMVILIQLMFAGKDSVNSI